jgi:ribosomal protein S18 acetylase RimI-like enzyme
MFHSPVELRAALAADAAAIADVLLTSRRTFLPYLASPRSDDEIRMWVRDTVLRTEQLTVAAADGAIVGFLAVHEREGMTWITHLYLLPSHVRQGIGTCLLAHAIASAPRPVRLYAFQQNEAARRFYERHGFVAVAFSDGTDNEEHCPDVLYELVR